jgi:hypothetical protein
LIDLRHCPISVGDHVSCAAVYWCTFVSLTHCGRLLLQSFCETWRDTLSLPYL